MLPSVLPAARGSLAAAVVLLVAGSEAALFAGLLPASARDLINVVLGVVIAKFGTVYDFYFGSAKPPSG